MGVRLRGSSQDPSGMWRGESRSPPPGRIPLHSGPLLSCPQINITSTNVAVRQVRSKVLQAAPERSADTG